MGWAKAWGWQPALPLEMAFGESLEGSNQDIKVPMPIEAKKTVALEAKKEEKKVLIEENIHSAASGQSSTSGEEGPNLAAVIKSWKDISARVRKNQALNALMNSCRVLAALPGMAFVSGASGTGRLCGWSGRPGRRHPPGSRRGR